MNWRIEKMKHLMTREELFVFWYVLKNEIDEGAKYDKRFDYARNRTLENITPEVSELMKARKSGIPKFDEFEVKRSALIDNYAMKDSSGKHVVNDGVYSFASEEIEKEATEKLINLGIEYKDAINEREKEIDIYNEIVKEEIEVDIVKTTFKSFPDSVSDQFTRILRPMIKETDEEIESIIME
jgi:hypothetical protein